jgi:hypothetical protein
MHVIKIRNKMLKIERFLIRKKEMHSLWLFSSHLILPMLSVSIV